MSAAGDSFASSGPSRHPLNLHRRVPATSDKLEFRSVRAGKGQERGRSTLSRQRPSSKRQAPSTPPRETIRSRAFSCLFVAILLRSPLSALRSPLSAPRSPQWPKRVLYKRTLFRYTPSLRQPPSRRSCPLHHGATLDGHEHSTPSNYRSIPTDFCAHSHPGHSTPASRDSSCGRPTQPRPPIRP
jgi:hypothetical protein